MVTLLVLLIVCVVATAVHKMTNYDPSDKIEYKRYVVNKLSEYVAYIAALFSLFIVMIQIIKTA